MASPDKSNLTIGATFDKAALDASMAEAQGSINAIPETFNLAFQEVSSAGKRALGQISADTKAAAASISEEWRNVAAASAVYTDAQKEVRAASRLVASGSDDEATSLGLLAAAKKHAADASAQLALAEKAAAGTAVKETIANEGLAGSLTHLRDRLTLTSEGIRGSLFETGGISSALGAALGIAVIGEYIDKLKESEVQFGLLATSSGVTVESLARLQAAFQLQGVPVDNFSQVLTRLAEHMAEAQDGDKTMADYFAALGVSADALKNQSLGLDGVLQLMAKHLQTNVGNTQDLGIAYALLGRGAGQFVSGLKGLNKTLEENADHINSVATATANAVQASDELDRAEKQLGQSAKSAVLPVMPYIVDALKFVSSSLSLCAYEMKVSFGEIRESWKSTEAMIVYGSKAVASALTGNFAQAADYIGAAQARMAAASREEARNASQYTKELAQSFSQIWAAAAQAQPTGHPPPLAGHKKHTDPDKTAMQGFEEQLALEKQSHEMSLADELAFWQSKEGLVRAGSSEYVQILKTEATLTRAIDKQAQQEQLAIARDRVSADAAALKMFAEGGAGALKSLFAQTEALAKSQVEAERELLAQLPEAITANAALAKSQLELRVKENKESGKQQLADQLTINKLEHDLLIAFYGQQISALDKADANYLAEKRRLLGEVQKVNMRFAAQNVQAQIQEAAQVTRVWQSGFNAINRTLDESVKGIIMGTQTMGMAWRRMGADMVASFAENMIKVGLQFLETHLFMRTVSAQTALKQVVNDAAGAFSGAYKAVVGIPIIGPELAPAAGALAFAAVMGEGALVSARGGQWSVPLDEQMTLLHKGESVIPAQYAEPLRRTVEGGGGGATHAHFSVTAVDSQSVERLFRRNGSALAKTARRMMRNRQFGGR